MFKDLKPPTPKDSADIWDFNNYFQDPPFFSKRVKGVLKVFFQKKLIYIYI